MSREKGFDLQVFPFKKTPILSLCVCVMCHLGGKQLWFFLWLMHQEKVFFQIFYSSIFMVCFEVLSIVLVNSQLSNQRPSFGNPASLFSPQVPWISNYRVIKFRHPPSHTALGVGGMHILMIMDKDSYRKHLSIYGKGFFSDQLVLSYPARSVCHLFQRQDGG